VLSSAVHQELARQRQADLARQAEHHRHVATAKREGSRGVTFAWVSAVLHRITILGHPSRKPQPAL
jgi:hypothetical protein